ncbi:MAG: acyl-CoA/acyl-ACP dehydrogenase [Deltaproteobacteria bacterium]|nr:acyl-CoA/acyl-ACP dehydrogenase [Deltaproteobacteria bacterium]
MTARTLSTDDLSTPAGRIATVRRLATSVVRDAADDVDRAGRFPAEAIAALRQARLLSAMVPAEQGGYGARLDELAAQCELLGGACASTGMIYAMHQIQVACLVRHGLPQPFFRDYLVQLSEQQRLIASVTSEAGVGGSVRTSISPVERGPEGCTFRKDGTVVSYGAEAQDLLTTVRRAADAPASDQVLVLTCGDQHQMKLTGTWDSLGMRGTCSPAYEVRATFPEAQIVPAHFADILSHTMLPFAHVLWGSVWLGIANDAVARARAWLRSVARQMPGQTPPAAFRFAEVSAQLQMMRALVHDAARRYGALLDSGDRNMLSSVGFGLSMSEVKISASRMVVEIVTAALRVCGTNGYRNDSPYSIGRHLRDAHSAALMIGNDRILSSNAPMHLAFKDEQ